MLASTMRRRISTQRMAFGMARLQSQGPAVCSAAMQTIGRGWVDILASSYQDVCYFASHLDSEKMSGCDPIFRPSSVTTHDYECMQKTRDCRQTSCRCHKKTAASKRPPCRTTTSRTRWPPRPKPPRPRRAWTRTSPRRAPTSSEVPP